MGKGRNPGEIRPPEIGPGSGTEKLGLLARAVRRVKIRMLRTQGWPYPEYALDYPNMVKELPTRVLNYAEDRPTFMQREDYYAGYKKGPQ